MNREGERASRERLGGSDIFSIHWSSTYLRSSDERCGGPDGDEPTEQLSVMLPCLTSKDCDEGLKWRKKNTSSKITPQHRYMPNTAATVIGKVSRKDQASASVQ